MVFTACALKSQIPIICLLFLARQALHYECIRRRLKAASRWPLTAGLIPIKLPGFDYGRVRAWLMLHIGHSAGLCCRSCQQMGVISSVMHRVPGLQMHDLHTGERFTSMSQKPGPSDEQVRAIFTLSVNREKTVGEDACM